MKYTFLFLFCLVCTSCINAKKNKELRLEIDEKSVKKIILDCGDQLVQLSDGEAKFLILQINSAKPVGLVKAIVRQELMIHYFDKDSLKISLFENQFKWAEGKDWTYKLAISEDYFSRKCNRL